MPNWGLPKCESVFKTKFPCEKCDQMGKLFVKIWPFVYMNEKLPIVLQRLTYLELHTKVTLKELPKTFKILPKWQNFAKSGHTGWWLNSNVHPFPSCLKIGKSSWPARNLKKFGPMRICLSASKCQILLVKAVWIFQTATTQFRQKVLFNGAPSHLEAPGSNPK